MWTPVRLAVAQLMGILTKKPIQTNKDRGCVMFTLSLCLVVVFKYLQLVILQMMSNGSSRLTVSGIASRDSLMSP